MKRRKAKGSKRLLKRKQDIERNFSKNGENQKIRLTTIRPLHDEKNRNGEAPSSLDNIYSLLGIERNLQVNDGHGSDHGFVASLSIDRDERNSFGDDHTAEEAHILDNETSDSAEHVEGYEEDRDNQHNLNIPSLYNNVNNNIIDEGQTDNDEIVEREGGLEASQGGLPFVPSERYLALDKLLTETGVNDAVMDLKNNPNKRKVLQAALAKLMAEEAQFNSTQKVHFLEDKKKETADPKEQRYVIEASPVVSTTWKLLQEEESRCVPPPVEQAFIFVCRHKNKTNVRLAMSLEPSLRVVRVEWFKDGLPAVLTQGYVGWEMRNNRICIEEYKYANDKGDYFCRVTTEKCQYTGTFHCYVEDWPAV